MYRIKDKASSIIQCKISDIPAETWNKEFELTNGSYSASNLQDKYQHIRFVFNKKTIFLPEPQFY